MDKINIIITSAGRRVSLVKAFQNEIRKTIKNGKVFTTDLNPVLSSACQVSDGAFTVPRVTEKDYIKILLQICEDNNIKIIIPTIDTELLFLAENEQLFLDKGIIPVISDLEIIKSCRDKRKIHQFFDDINLERAHEYELKNIKYPVFVKPCDGSRSQGIHLITDPSKLTKEITDNPKNMFLEYINPKDFKEFTIDIYCNKNSKTLAVVPRERIFVRDGEVNKACTRKNIIVPTIVEKFAKVKGLKGCITLQVFLHNTTNQICAIEINPRFGGGFPLTYLAKANFPLWIIQEYILDQEVETYFEGWEDNMLMLRYDNEVIVNGYTD